MDQQGTTTINRCSLQGDNRAPAAARKFLRATLAAWAPRDLAAETAQSLLDDAMLLTSELVTNAVVHAGTAVELCCRLESCPTETDDLPALIVEVSDHYPARPLIRAEPDAFTSAGRGLGLLSTIAHAWGISYANGLKTVWFRLCPSNTGSNCVPAPCETTHNQPPPSHEPPADNTQEFSRRWRHDGALAFLAEASDLLSGQFDEDKVAAMAGQLLVPRLADWCGIWLEPQDTKANQAPRLARTWHASESCAPELRACLENLAPEMVEQAQDWPVLLPWPQAVPVASRRHDSTGVAFACRLLAAGRKVGTLVFGRAGPSSLPNEATALIADFARRLALALASAREYTRHANTSKVLQRGLLPTSLATIPRMDTHVVYEPVGEGVTAGGDFYDLFRANDGRWCFALGDVCGHGPEAAVVIGLVRPLLKVLADDGYGVPQTLDRLNRILVDDAMSAADSSGQGGCWDEVRSLSLLYGELAPDGTGSIRCTLASAGHPLPLLLRPDGHVRPVAEPQLLLGVMDHTSYACQTFTFAPGDTLLCVTDGVTERRRGSRQLDDNEGLSRTLSGCVGLGAAGVAEQIRQTVHAFATEPPHDDLALLVLRAE